jgi:hypothetical protein
MIVYYIVPVLLYANIVPVVLHTSIVPVLLYLYTSIITVFI